MSNLELRESIFIRHDSNDGLYKIYFNSLDVSIRKHLLAENKDKSEAVKEAVRRIERLLELAKSIID